MSMLPSVKHKLMKVIYASALSFPKNGTNQKKLNSSSGLLSIIKKKVDKAKCAEV